MSSFSFLTSRAFFLRRGILCSQRTKIVDGSQLQKCWSSGQTPVKVCNNARPKLMNYCDDVIWPRVNSNLTLDVVKDIQREVDPTFSLEEFFRGARQALLFVSSHLARADLEGLKGYVEDATLQEIRENLHHNYRLNNRWALEVKHAADVFFNYPDKVEVLTNRASNGLVDHYVVITCIFHVLPGLASSKKESREKFLAYMKQNRSNLYSLKDRVMICNYRFVRDFSQGVYDDWMINMIHHFDLKP